MKRRNWALFLLVGFVGTATAIRADVVYNNGLSNIVASATSEPVQVSNNTVVTFNAGGNVTPFLSLGGLQTASLTAVSVFDTSSVIDNAADFSASMSTGGCNVNTAIGLSAAGTSVVNIVGGN